MPLNGLGGVVIASVGVLLLLGCTTRVAAASTSLLTLNLTAPISRVPRSFLSTTIDIATFVDHDHCNLHNETLRSMVRALKCKHIRVGGTEGDVTFYNNFPGSSLNVTDPSELPQNFRRIFTWRQWRDLLEFISAVDLKMYFGLNAGWGSDGLVRASLEDGGNWVSTMAEWLLNDLVSSGFADFVEAFEFSNEPNLFPFNGLFPNETLSLDLNGVKLAKDIPTIAAVLQTYSAANSEPWKLVCCDVAYVPLLGQIDNFTNEFAATLRSNNDNSTSVVVVGSGLPQLQATTFHFYPLFSSSFNQSLPPVIDPFYASVEKVLDPFILDQVGYWAERFFSDSGLKSNSPQTPVILGETGSAVGGGQNGLSNRFADVIEYGDKIGLMTQVGVNKMFRQTLCGSGDQYYALISHNLTTQPSYFMTAFFNHFIFQSSGGDDLVDVWNVGPASEEEEDVMIRSYAFSAGGGNVSSVFSPDNSSTSFIVIGLLNLKNSSHNVSISITGSSLVSPSEEGFFYSLMITSGASSATPTSTDDLLRSPSVLFNGHRMLFNTTTEAIEPALDTTLLRQVPMADIDITWSNQTIQLPVVAVGWSWWWIPVALPQRKDSL